MEILLPQFQSLYEIIKQKEGMLDTPPYLIPLNV